MKKWADFAVVEGINSSESNLWGCILIWEKVLPQNPSPYGSFLQLSHHSPNGPFFQSSSPMGHDPSNHKFSDESILG